MDGRTVKLTITLFLSLVFQGCNMLESHPYDVSGICHKSISAYYEIGTCDIYVLSVAGNSEIKFHELLQLCIGVRINFNR